MTNYLAIATVTSAFQSIIQNGIKNDLPGTAVTAVSPDTLNNAQKERRINIYLYQALPAQDFRQENFIPHRSQNGTTAQKSLRVDLHYLISFYGNDLELEPQQLLGSTIRTLVDRPLLETPHITEAINSSEFLADSTLAEQGQKVKFVPSPMTAEELIRIWSTMFKSPYTLSISYIGKGVIIEGGKAGKTALPVQRTQIYTELGRPFIEKIENLGRKNQPITLQSTLAIYGRQLQNNRTKVKIGNMTITPQKIEKTKVELDICSILSQTSGKLRAGIQNLQIVHQVNIKSVNKSLRNIESNSLPLVLCPNIVNDMQISNLEQNWDDFCSAKIKVEVDLTVGTTQKASLLMNQITNDNPQAYVFAAKSHRSLTNILEFIISDVKPGKYLIRVQIDGAESPLIIDEDFNSPTYKQYYAPKLEIGSPQLTESLQSLKNTFFPD